MKRILLAGIAGIVLVAPTYAWSTDPSPAPTATATATATGGAATATQRQHQGQRQSQSVTVNNAAPTSSGIDPATAARLAGGWQGAGGGRAPDVFVAPPAAGGQCGIVGFGAGGSGLGGGGGFGPSWESTNCRNYYIAKQLYAEGHTVAATILLSKITPEARDALADEAQQKQQPVAAAAPAAVVPATKTTPDWCFTASPAERRRHSKECNA